jgi:hypothetical protein
VDVGELPRDYVYWLLENVELRGGLRLAVFERLGIDIDCYEHLETRIAQLEASNQQLRDEVNRLTASRSNAPSVPQSLSAAFLTHKYRQFSLKYHPDRGGDTMCMTVINEVFDELRQGLTK